VSGRCLVDLLAAPGFWLLGFVHENVIAPNLDAIHSDEGTFKERAREEHRVLVAKTFGDEQAVARAAVVE